VKITRESTDLQYRRNEPDAYRRQARINEGDRYRAMLWSEVAALRARACEMLMHIEVEPQVLVRHLRPPDGGSCVFIPSGYQDRWFLAKLLEDRAVEVRRAAALALTRLATAAEDQALRQALKDTDWQVRFHAASALQVLDESRGRSHKELCQDVRADLAKPNPGARVLRAAGKLGDPEAVRLMVPWLKKHEWEYHAAEAAVALGRIGTPEAVAALWDAVRSEVPNRKVYISRYLQHGPRPEEYALLKGLIRADVWPKMNDVHLLIALLPNTFMEKPRYEDRMRAESQRVLMPRLLLERAGLRQRAVELLRAALDGVQKSDDPLYEQLLKGINLERPFSEHGRPFDVVKQIGPEEALWLLTCLLDPAADLPSPEKRQALEDRVVPFLTSKSHRERIDAAVLLSITGFGPKAADALAAEIARPYPFPEIASMGKGMPDDNFRDKAYFVLNLARHVDQVDKLRPFADPLKMTRDIRYGLTHGLAFRGKPDGIPLLVEMATRDPITLIRQQARYALADIQDTCRLAGRPVPEVKLPEPGPLEDLYPPRGLTWTDTSFVEFNRVVARPPAEIAALSGYVAACLVPGNFRNLNNAQASGAERMMTARVEETRLGLGSWLDHPGEPGRKPLQAALETPYPFAHYLAAKTLADRGEAEAVPVLMGKLDAYLKAQDVPGFWWCCEALARLKAREASPVLARHAVPANPPGVFGPEGMGTGYIAAKTLAQIIADPEQADIARCLASDNIWLQAGALRGLAEAKAPGIEAVLRQYADEEKPAVVRQEARIQLRRLELSHPVGVRP
jgi:hypothetical protein